MGLKYALSSGFNLSTVGISNKNSVYRTWLEKVEQGGKGSIMTMSFQQK